MKSMFSLAYSQMKQLITRNQSCESKFNAWWIFRVKYRRSFSIISFFLFGALKIELYKYHRKIENGVHLKKNE